jgi:Ca2+-binding RTX toxin-like protein
MGTALGFLRVRTYDNRPRNWMEALETRRLFSISTAADGPIMFDDQNQPVATAEVINGVLTVKTTDGVDDMMIGSLAGDPDHLYVQNNYARKIFPRAGITAISVDLGDGDDAYVANNFGGLLNLPTTVNGGAGNDEISGESDRNYLWELIPNIGDGPFAPAHFIGGEGNDTLVGGIGDTVVEGGPGENRMFGRPGLFTILDAPTPPNLPTPPFTHSGEDVFYILDDSVVPIQLISDPSAITASPESAVITPASDQTTTGQTAPIPNPVAAPSAISPPNSLLTAQGSLLGQRDDLLWN